MENQQMDRTRSIRHRLASNAAAYFLLVAIALTGFFALWRLILLILTWDSSLEVPGSVLFGSFLVGLRFDFTIACYITLFLTILGMIPFFDISRNRVLRQINHWFLYLIAAIVFFFHLADIEFFKFFNARLSGVALLWSESPEYMAGFVWETYPVIRYFLLYAAILTGFIYLARKLSRSLLDHRPRATVLTNSIWLIVLLALLSIGGRGRIEGRSPLRWGVAYFSPYSYANLLALNPTFTFTRDALYDAGSKEHTRQLMESIRDPQADAITRRLIGLPETQTGRLGRVIKFDPPNPDPPNVVVVIMESFSASMINALNNEWPYNLSPCFDSLASEGILFENIYSGGMHTFSGLFSTGYGYPHLFGDLVMKVVTGQNHFWGLPHILKEHGYQTQFYTTHDPIFDNMQGFFMANGVEKVYSLDDYGIGQKLSVNGVPDHVMFDYAIERFKELRTSNPDTDQPFCAILLSGSNHGPWIIPDVPFEKVPPNAEPQDALNAFKYADWSLGRFVRKLQADPAFENTLVVITSDNGHPKLNDSDMPLTQYHIPLLALWIKPDRPAPARVETLGSQLDIVATVMGQVRLNYDNYTFGRDLLDSTFSGVEFAHFTEWYRQGYIEDDYYCITRINGPESLYRLTDLRHDLADSLPHIVADYTRKSLAIYQSAYHNMSRPLSLTQDSAHAAEPPKSD